MGEKRRGDSILLKQNDLRSIKQSRHATKKRLGNLCLSIWARTYCTIVGGERKTILKNRCKTNRTISKGLKKSELAAEKLETSYLE